jgi:hypothetical protein
MKFQFAMKGEKRRREYWGKESRHNKQSHGQAYDGKQQEICSRDTKMAPIRPSVVWDDFSRTN